MIDKWRKNKERKKGRQIDRKKKRKKERDLKNKQRKLKEEK